MAEQLPLRIGLRDSSVFASYFAGRNRATRDALSSLRPGRPPTCVWLHGPASSGKTHLLQACCVRYGEQDESSAFLPLRGLSTGSECLSGYGQLGLVALDDADTVAGRADWERALFRLHQELEEQGGRMLVSGPAPPAAMRFHLPDLASRLNGGLVLTLQALDDAEQLQALQLRAQLRGFELPEDTAQYLLRRLPRDMTTLYAFLDELDEASLAAQRKLTVPFVRSIVEAEHDKQSAP